MPVDNVSVRREGKEEQWWLAKKNCRFSAQTLFDGPWGAIVPADVTDGLDVEYDDAHGQVANVRRYVPLPESTRRIVMLHGCDHPGIALDKFVYRYGDQKLAKPSLHQVIAVNDRLVAASHSMVFEGLRARWRTTVGAGCAPTCFVATTIGPLTLHLARASALENAGICLHPLYGFVYLPGSGLKGMARAFAETVWLDSQPDRRRAWMQIEDVFGWAATRERKEQIHNTEHPAQARRDPPDDTKGRIIDSSAGQIVFHDAWPTAWPKLIVDIANSHHSDYYSAREGDNGDAPGDWEGPIPIYFLAVAPGATFEFALTKRRGDAGDELLALAREWLSGALVHLGAGAKTAAGYGAFRLPDAPDAGTGGTPTAAPATRASASAIAGSSRRSFTTTLELITPAFLAGANQKPEDCDLRPATLRGLLRWWWRTLHAGHVDVATLRRMEAAIWGDTKQGSAVRIVAEPNAGASRFPRPGRKLEQGQHRSDDDFLRKNNIELAPGRTTQGLFYAAYGTDEMAREHGEPVRRQRQCVAEASRWQVRFDVRRTIVRVPDGKKFREEVIDAALIEAQVSSALWLLCQFGGVGAKSRKGFGSLALSVQADELRSLNLQKVQAAAKSFRDRWLHLRLPYASGRTGTHAVERMAFIEQATAWTNPWFALDQIGAVMQAFAQADPTTSHGKHCGAKAVLGLPRQIHGPRQQPLPGQDPAKWQRPLRLRGPAGDRHAAPVFYHVDRDQSGAFVVRVAVFDTDRLWDATSATGNAANARAAAAQVLKVLKTHLRTELAARAAQYSATGQAPVYVPAHKSAVAVTAPATALPKTGAWVEAELLGDRTKSGGWRAKHISSGISGPITNSADVPADKSAGDKLVLVVQSIPSNQKQINFRCPKPGEQEKTPKQPPPKGKGSSRGGQGYGRR